MSTVQSSQHQCLMSVHLQVLTKCHVMHTERPTTSEVHQWLESSAREGEAGVSDRVAPLETALQRLKAAVEEDRARTASEAADYTPQELQVSIHFST